ncbi:methyl-accepting chemotaxis protein [Thermodesulfovibrio yellowstonii]|uniref:Methyl-accepting chemotaxis protein n=1 Tax=Thermodesulfovibrio yellowstonii TaxID=28262 RepID=A0A9W6LK67_9BACT|nr:methyl-accepting chemotaxis protein [Thermodesulfovibrio islandicus]GLI52923.1 methyl-accepting chemotaxis protein [Thermodesulfovibrio islandicus]
MLVTLSRLMKRRNGKNYQIEQKNNDNELMERILGKSIELVDLSPLIEKEAEILKSGTEKIDEVVKTVSNEMDVVRTVLKELSLSASENVKRISIVSENIALTKESFKETETSMLSIKRAAETLTSTTLSVYDAIKMISSLATTIKEIADKTELLALNASIEAARAGENGRGFAIVAEEVGKLSHATMEATKDVSLKTRNIFSLIEKIKIETNIIEEQVQKTCVKVTENRKEIESIDTPLEELTCNAKKLENMSNDLTKTVNNVEQSLNVMSDFVKNAVLSSNNLRGFSNKLHELSEEQILETGKARIRIHKYAREIVEKAVLSSEIKSMFRFTMEQYLRELIYQYDIFELLYVTDDRGIQITKNMSKGDFQAQYGSTGYGEDWSNRKWFTEVKERLSTYISDIYISVATNSYCFTVSAPIFNENGKFVGVLGADVDLKKIIEFGNQRIV